jgi:NDP-mannose synthase
VEAVVLAGGKGTRLRPYTITIPKPLVPVGERPILELMIEGMRRSGVKRITMAVNHMSELVMAFFGDGSKFGIDIRYSIEDEPLGTVAPLKLIDDLPEHFLVMNGDLLTDIDYREVYESHLASGAGLTVTAFERENKIDFGVLDVDEASHRLVGFREKPVYRFNVSMGVYVFSRSVLERVPPGQRYGFDDLVLGLLEDGQPINVYTFRGYWLDIGRPDDFEQANQDLPRLLESWGEQP